MTKIIAVLFYLAFFVVVKSEECHTSEKQTYVCKCDTSKELEFFAEADDEPVSVEIRNCTSVTVDSFSGPTVGKITENFFFENIAETLKYSLQIWIENMTSFKIFNVNNVEWSNPYVFSLVKRLENVHVKNTKMKSFSEMLKKTDVNKLTLKNVTIENLDAILLGSNDGEYLHIIDCRIKVGKGNSIFKKFKQISINRTIFESSAPGNIEINGDEVILNRMTFINTSVNVIANNKIDVRGTCILGKESHVRFESPQIISYANKGPNKIRYVPEQSIESITNTVCEDDDCKCYWNDEELERPNRGGSIQHSLFLLSILVSYSLQA